MRTLALPVYLACLLTAFTAFGCTSQTPTPTPSPTPPVAADVTLSITEMDGGRRTVADLDAFLSEVPFDIVYPEMPPGYTLDGMGVRLPPSDHDEQARQRTTRLTLGYRSADGGITIDEWLAPPPGLAGGNPITIGSVEGEMYRDPENDLIGLAWPACGLGFNLIAFGTTRQTVLDVAESTLAKCE